MGFDKISFEESLAERVLAAGKCLGCGACVVVCPFNCLAQKNGEPSLVEECKDCGICAQVCPTYEWSWPSIENFVYERERKVEEEFGVYRRLVAARATDNRILEVCQDGGVVTALLSFALEKGLIDGAVVSGISREKPFHPTPKLAVTPKEVVECAGTRYSYSPNILALAEVIKQKKTSIAFVGTPCQIRAIRKMQLLGLKKYTRPVKILIGLMCSECFTYKGLMEKHVHETLGLELSDIRKMNIKGKILVETKSDVKTIPLSEAKQHARKSCKFCDDFSSELSDISAGGLGLNGWTFTIIRTERGQELLSHAEKSKVIETRNIDDEAGPLRLLRKLSRRKRRNPEIQEA